MAKVKRHSTGAAIYNPYNAQQITPRDRGQRNKQAREPRHEGPDLEEEIAKRVRGAVLADYAARVAADYVPDPKTGYTDVAAQTMDLLDALGLRLPGWVTIVLPAGGGVKHVTREEWDAWEVQAYHARLRQQRRRDIFKGEPAPLDEVALLAKTEMEDQALLRKGIDTWIEQLRDGKEYYDHE